MAKAILPIILSGGSGTRLWPLSRPIYPKQFIALSGTDSLLARTCKRVSDPTRYAAPILVCNEEHRFLIAEHSQQAGLTPQAIVLEPEGRNTAPAVAVAAVLAAKTDPEALLLVLPSDHWINDEAAFQYAVDAAAQQSDRLMTFGIAPDRPETGYGYIEPGEVLSGGARVLAAFHEKPDAQTAARYLDEGYLWNSGMFLLPLPLLLEEMAAYAPEVLEFAKAAVAGAKKDIDFIRLAAEQFKAAPAISFDHAVMEKTRRAGVLPAEMGWSDLGSWEALARLKESDAQGNQTYGNAYLMDARNSQARSDGPLVAGLGIEDLLVVAHDDAVLVAHRDRADEVKDLLAALQAAGHEEAAGGTQVHRPWGWYRNLQAGPGFLVKLIQVKPGARLSLQKHAHRAEHWVVVHGQARVTRNEEVIDLGPNQSTYIPLGARHRLENPGDTPLEIIEVQSGDQISEDDIERLDDVYGRLDS